MLKGSAPIQEVTFHQQTVVHEIRDRTYGYRHVAFECEIGGKVHVGLSFDPSITAGL